MAYAEKKIWSYFASFEVLFTCFHVSDFGSLQGYDSWFLKKKQPPITTEPVHAHHCVLRTRRNFKYTHDLNHKHVGGDTS